MFGLLALRMGCAIEGGIPRDFSLRAGFCDPIEGLGSQESPSRTDRSRGSRARVGAEIARSRRRKCET